MSVNKLSQARAAFGALIIGSTTGNPARGVGGAGAILQDTATPNPPIQAPNDMTPTTIHGFVRRFVDLTASGLWASSVTSSTGTDGSAIQLVPVVGSNVGDTIIDISPTIPTLAGIAWKPYMANAFDISAVGTSTAYIVGQVVSAQTITTYTRTSHVLKSGFAWVTDPGANYNDLGAHITGTNVASNTVVVHVKPGVGFMMSRKATGVTSGSASFAPFSALACIVAGTTAGSAPNYKTIPAPGQTIADGTATWVNLGTGCPALQWTNATGSTISNGAGLLATYQVSLLGLRP